MQISADPYERTVKRKARRNGTRTLKIVDGVLQLNKPRVWEFPFETKVIV